jgi:hypothetical protein
LDGGDAFGPGLQDREDVNVALRNAENVTLSALYVYPIKSCAGISIDSAELSATGLRHDRRWMLVDETGDFMSQRAHQRMALISVHLSDERLTVGAPGMPDLEVPLRRENEKRIDVSVWGDTSRAALVGGEADRWFGEFLQFTCRLVYKPDDDLRLVDSMYAKSGDQVGFADACPFLLISEASLDDLNGRLADPPSVNRFRPNFVVTAFFGVVDPLDISATRRLFRTASASVHEAMFAWVNIIASCYQRLQPLRRRRLGPSPDRERPFPRRRRVSALRRNHDRPENGRPRQRAASHAGDLP